MKHATANIAATLVILLIWPVALLLAVSLVTAMCAQACLKVWF